MEKYFQLCTTKTKPAYYDASEINADCYHVPDTSVGFDSFGGNSIVNNKETVWEGKYDSRNTLNSLYR